MKNYTEEFTKAAEHQGREAASDTDMQVKINGQLLGVGSPCPLMWLPGTELSQPGEIWNSLGQTLSNVDPERVLACFSSFGPEDCTDFVSQCF